MTPKTVRRVQDAWTDMAVIASVMTHHRDDRTSMPDRPTPTSTPSAEEESDRWVAQALVECYNA
jgi:hypothetical protein